MIEKRSASFLTSTANMIENAKVDAMDQVVGPQLPIASRPKFEFIPCGSVELGATVRYFA